MGDLRAGRFDGLVLGGAVAVALLCVFPCALHDESLAVLGLPGTPAAVAGTPLARALRLAVTLLGHLGLPTYMAALGLLAAATGLAVFAVHQMARAGGGSRGAALGAGALVATCPAAAVAATTVHVHAFVLLLAALATWLAARTAARGSWRFAAALGVTCGVAHWAAPIGALLPLLVVPLLLLEPAAEVLSSRRTAALVLVALGTWLGLAAVLQRGDLTAGLPSGEQVASYDVGTLGPLLLRDGLRAFLPLSLVVLGALGAARGHRHALVLAGLALLHTVVGCHLTGTLGDDGSFLLPLLPASALLAARLLSGRLCLAAVLAGLAISATKVALRADWHAASEFTAGVHELAAGRPFTLITGPRRDEAFVLARLPRIAPVRVVPVCDGAATPDGFAQDLQQRLTGGQRVLLTDEAEQALRDPVFRARHAAAGAVLKQLEATFTLTFVTARGFAGRELAAR